VQQINSSKTVLVSKKNPCCYVSITTWIFFVSWLNTNYTITPAMLLQKIFRIGAILLLLPTLLLTACNTQLPGMPVTDSSHFQSDQQLEANFQAHKAEFENVLKLVRNCDVHTTFLKSDLSYTGQPGFFVCPVSENQLKPLNIKEVSEALISDQPSKNSNVAPVLFTVDQAKYSISDVWVEEKGYIFSPTPIQEGLVEQGTLDQFSGKELIEKVSIRAAWKYKKIGGGWYLYFRQYFRVFMN
jgi:hypothetical protein